MSVIEIFRQPFANIRFVNLKTWLIFVCIQTAGVVAMHLGYDWSLILGVLLLVPGIPALYMFSGIHRLIMIGDFRLAVAGILINAGVWWGSASILRWLRKKA